MVIYSRFWVFGLKVLCQNASREHLSNTKHKTAEGPQNVEGFRLNASREHLPNTKHKTQNPKRPKAL